MDRFKYIKELFWQHKYKYLAGIICLIIVDILQLFLPKVFGLVTDELESGSLERSGLFRYASIVFLIALSIALMRFLWRYLIFGSAIKIETLLRNKFYSHLQKMSVNYYNNNKTGDLMAHATNDLNNIRMATGPGIAVAFDSTLIPIVAVAMMLNTVGYKLTFAAFTPILMLGIIIAVFVRKMHRTVENMQEAFSSLTETARENFSGIRVVKSFTQEIKEIAKFQKSNQHNKEMNIRYIRIMSMLHPIILSISALSFAIALLFGGIAVIYGDITLGDFIAFNGYLGMLVWPIAAMGWLTSLFQRGSVSLKRINKILDIFPEITDNEHTKNIKKIDGTIEFKNLDFSYPGNKNKILENINLKVEKGKTLAVVGKTGSGKTTLANLIPRLFGVEKGMLSIDGTDINEIPLTLLRNSIGYVPQDAFLFSTTIKENIDFYRNASVGEIEEAAKTADVYDNIIKFPHRFDTVVGERGITLSGGQKQRISISRAIIGNPSILILDDCLSAVDTQTEEKILKKLSEVIKHRTTIIISHRISTIKNADEIIVLEEGKIAERGTHSLLLDKKGIYHELYQKQLIEEQLMKGENQIVR